MVDPIILQSISILVSSLGIIVAIIYYAQVLRNTSKARQRDLVFQRYQDYGQGYGKAIAEINTFEWENVDEWQRKYGMLANPDAWSSWLYISRIYNMAGILLMENVAEADLIFRLYDPGTLIGIWERFEQVVFFRRDRINDPSFYEPFEFLYREAKRRFPDIRSLRPIDPGSL